MALQTKARRRTTELISKSRRSIPNIDSLTAYINAGGRGTRLNSIFKPDARIGVSKAMLPIGNPPILLIDHQINQLQESAIPMIIVGAGDHTNVTKYIDLKFSTSSHIHAFNHSTQLGTGGDLIRSFRQHADLFGRHVLVINVDGLIDLDYGAFFQFHINSDAALTIALTLSPHAPNHGAFYVNSLDKVIYTKEVQANPVSFAYAQKNCHYQASSTGAMIISTKILADLKWEPSDEPFCLYKNLVAQALKLDKVFAYNNGHRLFADIGTVNSWNDIHNHWEIWQTVVKSKSISQ